MAIEVEVAKCSSRGKAKRLGNVTVTCPGTLRVFGSIDRMDGLADGYRMFNTNSYV